MLRTFLPFLPFHRKPTKYKDNITASLALPATPMKVRPSTSQIMDGLNSQKHIDSIPIRQKMESLEARVQMRLKKFELIDDLRLEQVDLVWNEVIEHANRRADFFFYLLIAVYKRYVVLSKDDTVKQHGIGCKRCGTNACHCSLFPSIQLMPMPVELVPSGLHANRPLDFLTLNNTHFGETLNSTVEAPRVVNVFDMHLEGKVHDPSGEVRSLIDILNKVSLGVETPKQGMDEFYRVMKVFFQNFVKEDFKRIAADTPKAIMRVCEYEREGTFRGANENQTGMSDEYFALLMGLKGKTDLTTIENKYLEIQKTIYDTKPVMKQRYPRAHKEKEHSHRTTLHHPSATTLRHPAA